MRVVPKQQETVVVDSMEYWEFEILYETIGLVDKFLPDAPKQTRDDVINDIYDLIWEAHERKSAETEG